MRKARHHSRQKRQPHLIDLLDDLENCSMNIALIAALLQQCEDKHLDGKIIANAGCFIFQEIEKLTATVKDMTRPLRSSK